jgi:1-acyl-sn-glycerol-3-phosphate acyltransferase
MDFLEDIELYNEAMINAYNVITKKVRIKDVLIELDDEVEIEEFPLPFNPFLHENISDEEIDLVIEHFSDLEEYEMCAELVECKQNVKKHK